MHPQWILILYHQGLDLWSWVGRVTTEEVGAWGRLVRDIVSPGSSVSTHNQYLTCIDLRLGLIVTERYSFQPNERIRMA